MKSSYMNYSVTNIGLKQRRGVLSEIFVTVGVEDRLIWIGDRQVLAILRTVSEVPGATVDGEVGNFMDEGSGLGICTVGGGVPEGATEVNLSGEVGICQSRYLSVARITISGLKAIRTDVGEEVSSSAGTVVGEGREVIAVDKLEVVLNGALMSIVVGTKPGGVSFCGARDARNVIVGFAGVGLGVRSGNIDS